MMKRVRTILDPEIEARGYAKILSRVEVRLRDGRVLKKESGPYRGGPDHPLTDAELQEKFGSCAELALPKAKISRAFDLLNRIETLQEIRPLMSILIPD